MLNPAKRQRITDPAGSRPGHAPSSSAPAYAPAPNDGPQMHGLDHRPATPGPSRPRPLGAATAALHRHVDEAAPVTMGPMEGVALPRLQGLGADAPRPLLPGISDILAPAVPREPGQPASVVPPPRMLTPDGRHVSLDGRRAIVSLNAQGRDDPSIADELALSPTQVTRVLAAHADVLRLRPPESIEEAAPTGAAPGPGGSRTPHTRLSVTEQKTIRDLLVAKASHKSISESLSVPHSTVSSFAAREGKALGTLRKRVDRQAAEPGLKTPKNVHLTLKGKHRLRDLRAINPGWGMERLARFVAVSAEVARRTLVQMNRQSTPLGMMTPDGSGVSNLGRETILGLYGAPSRSAHRIGLRLGVPPSEVEAVIREAASGLVQAAPAPPRPTVPLADRNDVALRGWNIGDRISVWTNGIPEYFEVMRNRQQGEAWSTADFRPDLRGG